MITEDTTTSYSSDKDQKQPSTLPADDTTKPTNEKKVVVVTPSSKTEYKQSLSQYSSSDGQMEKAQHSISAKAKMAWRSLKELVTSTGKNGTSSVASQPPSIDGNLEYSRILVPHDGSDMADKALNHAIYLSKMSRAEIVIIHVALVQCWQLLKKETKTL